MSKRRKFYSEAAGILPASLNKANKKAKRRGCPGRLTLSDWFEFHRLYPNCLRCGATPVTLDHVVPLVIAGPNTLDNLQGLCVTCNWYKNVAIMDYRVKGLLPAPGRAVQ